MKFAEDIAEVLKTYRSAGYVVTTFQLETENGKTTASLIPKPKRKRKADGEGGDDDEDDLLFASSED